MENNFDPFKFEQPLSTKEFSWRTKIIAIVIAFLFFVIPLYEISEYTFPIYDGFVNCGCFGCG